MFILVILCMHKEEHLTCIDSITNKHHVYSSLECTTSVYINTLTYCNIDSDTCKVIICI